MENFERYANYTRTQNWKWICQLNKVPFDSFGTKKEIKVLPNYLEPDEVVFAITSGIMPQTTTSNALDWGPNTWLVALTNERFLFLDAAMLTKSVDSQSIRLDRVQAVSASQGFMLGKIMIDIGARIVTVDNCLKSSVAPMANLANKLLKEMQAGKTVEPAAVEPKTEPSPLEKLERLSALYKSGALTDEEFGLAKKKVLDSL